MRNRLVVQEIVESTPVDSRVRPLPATTAAFLGAVLSLTALHPGGARAQGASGAGDTGLSEIVVTAQKRAEDLKDVPLSISVLNGGQLDSQKIVDYEDLARVVPSLAVTNTGNAGLSRISLRGISSEEGSATVGIYLNDISLSVPNINLSGETLPRAMDIAQVEVLRGPQGTLFGASSLGGAIRFIPNEPKLDKFEGEVGVDVANTHLAGTDHLVEGVVNIPIVSELIALRIAAQGSDDKGFITRYDLPIGTTGTPPPGTASSKVGDDRSIDVRATLLIKPDDSLSIEPSMLYQRSYADGTDIFDLSYLPGFAQNRTTAEHILDLLRVESLTVHKDFDAVQLTSITGYVRRDLNRQLDGQSYDSDYVAYTLDNTFGPTYNTFAALKSPYIDNTIDEQFSQELRAASRSIKESGKPYEWQVGAYFSNQAVKSFDDEMITGLGQALTTLNGAPEIFGVPVVNDVIGYFPFETHTFEKALFGQASYVILPKLTATVGVRKSWADIRYDYDQFGFFGGTPPTYQNTHSENPVLPRFSLSYDVTDDATVYTTVAKGYRLGGSNPPLPGYCSAGEAALGLGNIQGSYHSDSLWSYEGGAKLRFLDNRLSVNAAAFFINWSNIQQSLAIPDDCGYTVTVNAGKAHSYGGEWEITGRLTANLSLTFTGAITDAHITDAAPGSGATDGQSVLSVPRANFSFGPDYQQSFGENWVAHAHFDVNYTGTSHGTFDTTNADYNRPDYTVVNLNAGVSRGPLDVSLFARNLLDNDKEIQTPDVLFIEQGIRVRPRTVGLSVRYKF